MTAVEKIGETLSRHGWPPATLVVTILLAVALFFMYQDNKEGQEKWEKLANRTLEAILKANEQREFARKMLEENTKAQKRHSFVLEAIENARASQVALDQQLTAAAVGALRQISDKLDVNIQVGATPEGVLESR